MVNVFKSAIAIINIINIQMMNKILSLSTSSKKYYEAGRIMNFITVDTQQVFMVVGFSHMFVYCPIVILVAIILIIVEVGWIGIFTPIFFFMGGYL